MAHKDVRTLKTKTGKRGGKRKNAGRKPGIVAQARKSIGERLNDGERAFNFLVNVLDDPTAETRDKINAAKEILNRVYGTAQPKDPAPVDVNVKLSADQSYADAMKKVYGPIADRLGITRG